MEVVPIIAPDHACRIAGIPLHRALRDGKILAQVLLAARNRYGHDMVLVWCDMRLEAEALGAGLAYEGSAFPHVVETVEPDRVDWSFDPGRGRVGVMLEAVRACREAIPPEEPLGASLKGPLSLAALVTGMESFLESLLTDPDRARRAIEGATAFQSAFAKALAEAGGTPWFGDPLAAGEMLGSRWFGPFARPALEAVVGAARAAAGETAVHICGDPADIIGEFPSIGADWWSLEVADLAAAKARLPDALL
ncbi:MAG: uroporphyrinogen decarboxylase family protein, partial [Planctomycetota bacterium]